MINKSLPEQLFEFGIVDLVSVIPPGATLTPTSKIKLDQVGKVPGRRGANGMWAGYDWRKHNATLEDVKRWTLEGANIGVRADTVPAVDIDTMDGSLAQIIEDVALAKLGPAPIRTGKAPKRLLMYETKEPFSRMRLWIQKGGESHLVEILGQGQQYLVYGTHPGTLRPYEWKKDDTEFCPFLPRTVITREQADAFLTELAKTVETLGVGKIEREGDGRPITHTAVADQQELYAPSLELLEQAVSVIPNTNELFADRTSYLRMGYAIRAAAGESEHEGESIFQEWASRWEGNDRFAANDPQTVHDDWRRMRGPYAVGWSWVAEQASAFGFETATLDFEPVDVGPAAREEHAVLAPIYSDQWLADKVVEQRRGELRFAPQRKQWYVWDEGMWKPDAELLAENIVVQELRKIANTILWRGATGKEIKHMEERAESTCSAGKASAVRTLMQSDRRIAVGIEQLDFDQWVLNTPSGIVDLKTGALLPANPDMLCTRSTSVPPEFGGSTPEWNRFLAEATAGDMELQNYLKRVAGYCLTGSTREQNLTFIYGGGGNGKGTFLNAIAGIEHDYTATASMDTFTASNSERHSTDIAMLAGARLVTASETQAGKRWDEAKVSLLTGGDPVTARFMRENNFTYLPQFKLVFIGNHRPDIRNLNDAMRRRIQIVPFTVTPKRVDKELGAKLRKEWPAILAWMIEGCVEWQRHGLIPPKRVQDTTQEYFTETDPIGKWIEERLDTNAEARTEMRDLYSSWREWAGEYGEYVGSLKRLSTDLSARKIERYQDGKSRRSGFIGYKIRERSEWEKL